MTNMHFRKQNICLFLVIFFLIFSFIFLSASIISSNPYDITAFAAVGAKPNKAATLDNGYIKTGENVIFTSAANEDVSAPGTWPTGAGYETGEYFARDFYSVAGTNTRFSSEMVQFYGGKVGILLMVNNESYPLNALAQALKSNLFIIKLRFEVNITIQSSNPSNVELTTSLGWYPTGVNNAAQSRITQNIIQPAGSFFNKVAILGGDESDNPEDAPIASNVLFTTANIDHDNACFLIEVADTSNSGNLEIQLTAPRVYIDIDTSDLSINLDEYTAIISGQNRQTVNIPGIKNPSSSGPELLNNTFVKAGDKINMLARVDRAGLPFVFPSYYTALFYSFNEDNFPNRTCIDWHTYNSTYGEQIESYLEVIPLDIDASEEEKVARKSGYNMSFLVRNGVGSSPQVKLLPRLPVGIERGVVNYYDYNESSIPDIEIRVKVDSTAPSAPIIDKTKGLGLSIENRSWYTTSRNMFLEYSSDLTTDFESNAKEKVYAYVLDSNVGDFDVTRCDFAKPVNDPSNNYPYFGVGSPSSEQAQLQNLGIFSNILNLAEKFQLNFQAPGEYTLVLIGLDEAGNISSPVIYHKGNQQSVKVDDTTQEVGFILRYGTVEFVNNYASNVGNIYIYTGNNWHEKDESTQSWTCTAPETTTSGDGVYVRRVQAVKRNMPVTLRFTMMPTHYNNYMLVRYSNQPAMEGMFSDAPTFRPGRDNSRIYEITFFINDEIWNSGQNSGVVNMYFNKRVDIGLTTTDFVFSKDPLGNGNIVSLDGYFETFFPYNPSTGTKIYPDRQPDINIKYYNLHEYVIYVPTILSGDTIVTTTGGYIDYKGNQYAVPSDYDLVARTRVTNTAFFPTLGVDGTNLTTLTRVEGVATPTHKVFIAQGYIASQEKDVGFVDAGKYVYKATVDLTGDTNLFGEKVAIFEIRKASPRIFGLHTRNTLFYGDNLGQLMLASIYENNAPITDSGFEYASRHYYLSSAGVYGYYDISSPQPGTPQYTLPDVVDSMPITVRFYPIDVVAGVTNEIIRDNWNQVFSQYYTRTLINPAGPVYSYELIEGKSHRGNYDVQVMEIQIEVRPAKAYIGVNLAATRVTFNEEPQGLTAIAYKDVDKTEVIEGVPFIISYRDKSVEGSPFSTDKPTNAGIYQARINIDSTRSNYENEEPFYQDFTIEKKELGIYPVVQTGELELTDYIYEKFTTPEIVGTYEVSHMFSFIYGYLDVPSYKFGIYDNGTLEEIEGLLVKHSFSKIKDESGNYLDPFGAWQEQDISGILISDMLSAGHHLAEISIDNQNYSGHIYAIFKINQGTPEGNLLSIDVPLFKRTYDAIGLDGTLQGKLGHIEFGQTLASKIPTMLSGLNTNALYHFRNRTGAISGRFYFESEDSYYSRQLPQNISNFYDENGNRILNVKYGTGGTANRIFPHTVTLYWEAGEYIETEDANGVIVNIFVPNKNFNIVSFPADIYVVRATPNATGLSMASLVYGQKLSESSFLGSVVSNGKVLTEGTHYTVRFVTNVETIFIGGNHNVRCSISILDEHKRQYIGVDNILVPIHIAKKVVDITFPSSVERDIAEDEYSGSVTNPHGVVYVYGSMYANPATITRDEESGNMLANVPLFYYYFKEKPEGNYTLQPGESYLEGYEDYVRIESINNTTPTGRYFILVKAIGDNYEGSVFKDFYVIKATLNYTQPTIPSIEYGKTLGDCVFPQTVVQNATSTIIVPGKFAFVDSGIQPEVNTQNMYLLNFIPSSSSASVYANFKPLLFEMRVIVMKKTLSIETSDLIHSYTGLPKHIIASVFNPELPSETLPLVYSYSTNDGQAPRESGRYSVTVAINDSVPHYRGSKTVELEIKKSYVTIKTEEVEKAYNGMTQNFVPVYTFEPGVMERNFAVSDVDGFKIKYYNRHSVEMASAPIKVGLYQVSIELVTRNYFGEATIVYYIAPSIQQVKNLSQTFIPPSLDPNAPRIKKVELEFNKVTVIRKDEEGNDYSVIENHQPVNYIVSYRYVQAGGSQIEFDSNLDISNAGVYDIRIEFSENGFNKVMQGYQLEVGKATIGIDLQNSYKVTYTGSHIPLNFVDLPADVQDAIYYYKPIGSEEEFSNTTPPINAGKYLVKIVLVSDNYQGDGITELEILKALPIITELPRTQEIQFNTNKEDVEFLPNIGSVRFSTTGEILTNRGTWSIETDISLYIVGTGYPVVVRFTPDESISNNFLIAEKEMNISISQKDIGSHIVFDESTLVKTYSTKAQGAIANIAPSANIVEGYGRILLTYQYDGVIANKTAVGQYTLVVKVEDKNYKGVSTPRMFEIKMATPLIVPPQINNINLGATLENSYIVPQTGHGINPNDDQVIVRGEFTFVGSGTMVMNEANKRMVEMTFMPQETSNYKSVTFEVEVVVKGTDINITSATATSPGGINYSYGVPLSSFSLNIEINNNPATEADGTWRWVNPNEIVSVGGFAKYIFEPIDQINNNIYEGEVEISNIIPATMQVNSSFVSIYVGNKISLSDPTSTLTIDFNVVNEAFPNLSIEPTLEILQADNPLIDFNQMIAFPAHAGANLMYNGNEVNITFRLRSPNYNETSITIPVKVFYHILPSDVTVLNSFKYYDGINPTVEDFEILVSGTSRPLQDNALHIKKIETQGHAVDNISIPGNYSVKIQIIDTHYRGEFSFNYEVRKNNISHDINVAYVDRVYADNTPVASVFFTEYSTAIATTGSRIIYSYWTFDRNTELGALPPRDAGEYWLKVSIDLEDIYFSAEKEVKYTINKKEIALILNNSYSYKYGQDYSIIPEIGSGLSIDNCDVRYYESGKSEPLLTKPSNVGRYTIKFVLHHKNYYGSRDTTLVINRIRLELNIMPTISSLEYSTKLGSAGFSGGEVVTADTEANKIEGSFVFVDPTLTPPVGMQVVQVRFEPNDKNYEPITFTTEIIIKKRKASVNFMVADLEYNGAAQLPIIATDPVAGIRVRFTIYKDGLNVSNAIEVGSYKIVATIYDDNYEGTSELNGFQIYKAKAKESLCTMPIASPIEYNQALNRSTLIDGVMIYVQGGNPVAGKFIYVNADLMLGPVGLYENIAFKFVPVDTNNYEQYEGTTSVSVIKTYASIFAYDTTFTYGDHITRPRFVTNPGNLQVLNVEFENDLANIKDVGEYRYTATISDHNYYGSLIYNITILKKVVDIQFYQGIVPVTIYRATYGNLIYAKARINTSSLVPSDIQYLTDIETNLMYRYSGIAGGPVFNTPPVKIGEYKAYVTINHRNYTLDERKSWLFYEVGRADVERLEFDHISLSTQIYGSVTVPSVLVTPSNVDVKVTFPGSAGVPQTAGTHSIRVEVVDPNYNTAHKNATFIILPKEISIENIIAMDKAVDGLSDIKVSGQLGGVLQGDEVFLTLTARTENWAINVGTHNVIVDSWRLSGPHAANYRVRPPVYLIHAKITNKVIRDENSQSYISSSTGFSSNVTVSFDDVYDTVNKTNIFTRLIGQKATVQTINLRQNGINTVLEEKVKFYVKIPDAYLNVKNLEVKGLGDLANQHLQFTREGDYMTFSADTSGEVIFYTNDFPYWIIIVAATGLILVVGAVLLLILVPKRKRKSITPEMRKTSEWAKQVEQYENKNEMIRQMREREKKRRWKL